jgi:type VI secretion system protein ImpK
MADLVQELTGECFGAIARLRELDGPVPSPETVHARICGYIEALKQRASRHGVSERDSQDMTYALVALTDEVAINSPEPLRSFWMNKPLQLQYFG